jgi:hypothetical protein
MYWDDHPVPHFHAEYGEFAATVSIETLALLHGTLPRRVKALVVEWADAHRAELQADWALARAQEPLVPIAPLDRD